MNYEYCDGMTYTIKKGDSLYEISRRHNVALGLLLRANPFVDVFNLQVGDTICIPGKQAQTATLFQPDHINAETGDMGDQTGIAESLNSQTGTAQMYSRADSRTGSGIMPGGSGSQTATGGMPAGSGNQMAGEMPGADSSRMAAGGMPAGNGSQIAGEMPGADSSRMAAGGMPAGNGSQMTGEMPGADSSRMAAGRMSGESGNQMAGEMPGADSSRMATGGMPEGSGSRMADREMLGTGGSQTTVLENRQTGRPEAVDSVENRSAAGREQMDEMLVWSEQKPNKKRNEKPDNGHDQWIRYVVQAGDTLGELLGKMCGEEEDFWEKNHADGIYLLPGVAYYIRAGEDHKD